MSEKHTHDIKFDGVDNYIENKINYLVELQLITVDGDYIGIKSTVKECTQQGAYQKIYDLVKDKIQTMLYHSIKEQ
ncbi:MAG: hypothetical protein ACTSP4_00870 [Candidatus Hodarchaeales archaeon]